MIRNAKSHASGQMWRCVQVALFCIQFYSVGKHYAILWSFERVIQRWGVVLGCDTAGQYHKFSPWWNTPNNKTVNSDMYIIYLITNFFHFIKWSTTPSSSFIQTRLYNWEKLGDLQTISVPTISYMYVHSSNSQL